MIWTLIAVIAASGGQPRNTGLTASQATDTIAAILTQTKFAQPLDKPTVQAVETVTNAIDWDAESIASYGEFLTKAEDRAHDRLFPYFYFCAATGLVCAAWDHHLGRPQIVLSYGALGCPDKSVSLIKGESGLTPQLRASVQWPWIADAKRQLILRDILISPWAGSIEHRFGSYVPNWTNARTKL